MKKSRVGGPFGNLDAIVQKAGIRLGEIDPVESLPAPKVEEQPEPESDEMLFTREMSGVNRANWIHEIVPSDPAPPIVCSDSGAEELRLMKAAVEGMPALEIPAHPEYIEGWVGVAGKRYLPGLRNGNYSIQGQIDLHGMGQGEARLAVEEFIERMSRFISCCVKIIHGRGINSPDDRAVLKESLQRWLSTRRLSRHVVAYASAPLKDGGVGAIYLLLKPGP